MDRPSQVQAQPLEPGSRAPSFALRDAPYSRVTLEDFAGRAVVLVFYVADWDPVAVAQLRRLDELRPHFDQLNATVVGISVDTVWSHSAFSRAHDFGFGLLSDDEPLGTAARAYGVLASEAGRSARALFVIDADGVVRWSAAFPTIVDPGVDGILAALDDLADQDLVTSRGARDRRRSTVGAGDG